MIDNELEEKIDDINELLLTYNNREIRLVKSFMDHGSKINTMFVAISPYLQLDFKTELVREMESYYEDLIDYLDTLELRGNATQEFLVLINKQYSELLEEVVKKNNA